MTIKMITRFLLFFAFTTYRSIQAATESKTNLDNRTTRSEVQDLVQLLFDAAAAGDNDQIDQLFPRVNINAVDKWGKNALHIAAENGKNSTIALLLDTYHMDIKSGDKEGYTALYWAKQKGHNTTVQLLEEKGLNQAVIKG